MKNPFILIMPWVSSRFCGWQKHRCAVLTPIQDTNKCSLNLSNTIAWFWIDRDESVISIRLNPALRTDWWDCVWHCPKDHCFLYFSNFKIFTFSSIEQHMLKLVILVKCHSCSWIISNVQCEFCSTMPLCLLLTTDSSSIPLHSTRATLTLSSQAFQELCNHWCVRQN